MVTVYFNWEVRMCKNYNVFMFAGLTAAQVHRHHLTKIDLCDDRLGQVNHAINPSPFAIAYMRRSWKSREFGGLNNLSVFEAMEKYKKDNPEITLKIEQSGDGYCVALITPFMKRAHNTLREAGEVVFVDSIGCVPVQHCCDTLCWTSGCSTFSCTLYILPGRGGANQRLVMYSSVLYFGLFILTKYRLNIAV